MRFALLGDHPDGLDIARALVESGRHELVSYSGPIAGARHLERHGLTCQSAGDVEEVLANPAIEAIIVAGRPADRPEQLRRAIQSERHVLCAQPVDTSPDTAYEAALIQGDTGQVLLPLLPERLHPGIRRLSELARALSRRDEVRLLEVEQWSLERVVVYAGGKKQKASLPGWDVLRSLGGEIAEVFAFAAHEAVEADEPLLLMGRFESGGLFQATYLSGQHEALWRLALVTRFGRDELVFPQGWPGAARLTWRDEAGTSRVEEFPAWNPWPPLVDVFEEAVAQSGASARERINGPAISGPMAASRDAVRNRPKAMHAPGSGMSAPINSLTWQDAVRLLELDDAARRSVEKRRASALEYQEATEEAGFKGLMTLFGCSLLWVSIGLLIVSRWLPWAGWLIAPLFGIFLLMQLLRWGMPRAAVRGTPKEIRRQEAVSSLNSEHDGA